MVIFQISHDGLVRYRNGFKQFGEVPSTGPKVYDDLYRTIREAKRAIGRLPGFTVHRRNWKLVYCIARENGGAAVYRSYTKSVRAVGGVKERVFIRRLL